MPEIQEDSVSRVAQEGYDQIKKLSEGVPEEVLALAEVAAGMRHSIFHTFYVNEGILKAYWIGFRRGQAKE